MAIAHIGTDSKVSAAATATLNVTKPTGITPGASDRLTLVVQTGNSGGAVGSYTASAGWTLIGQVLNVAGGGNISLQAWHAAGDVTLAGFSQVGSATDLAWIMGCFSGVDTTTPVDAGTPNSNTGATSLTTNAVTVAADQSWHLIAFSDWLNGTYSAPGFTVSASPTSNDEAALLYNTTPKSIGSTGTVVVTSSAAASGQALIGIPFALRPQAPATQEQEGFRFRNDDGSETTATWAAPQDTNITAPLGTVERLRVLVNGSSNPNASAYQLEARVNGAAWRRVRANQ